MRFNVRFISRSAIIAAAYAAVTFILQPISFGMVQFRVSEAFCALPMLMPEAVPGLFIGCIAANLLGGGAVYDVIFGSIATLMAAILTRKLKERTALSLSMPVIFNGVIVGCVVYFCYVMSKDVFSAEWLIMTCASVAVGEAAVMYTLGLALVKALRKTKLIDKQ